jgi:uncharacterized protein (TIGR03435 family)
MDPPPCRLMGGPARMIAGGTTMEQLATNLGLRVERAVIDKTGLSGRFEFNLAFTPIECQPERRRHKDYS